MSMDAQFAGSGYLAQPAAPTGPGILVLHAWWGLTDHVRGACDALADRGLRRARARSLRRSRHRPIPRTLSACSPRPTPTSWPTSPGPASTPCAPCRSRAATRSGCSAGRWVRRWRCGWRLGCQRPSPRPPSTTAARTSTWSTHAPRSSGTTPKPTTSSTRTTSVLLESELHLDGLEVDVPPLSRHPALVRRARPAGARRGRRRAGLGTHPHVLRPAPPGGLTHHCALWSPSTRMCRCLSAPTRMRSRWPGRSVEGGAEGRDARAEVLGGRHRRGAGASAPTPPPRRRRAPRRRPPASGVAMPKPMITGRSVVAFRRLASTVDESASSPRSPVTPSRFTP